MAKSIMKVKKPKVDTTTVSFRVPTNKVEIFKMLVEPLKENMREGKISHKLYLQTIIESLKIFLDDSTTDK